jgi:hypothetical protein
VVAAARDAAVAVARDAVVAVARDAVVAAARDAGEGLELAVSLSAHLCLNCFPRPSYFLIFSLLGRNNQSSVTRTI